MASHGAENAMKMETSLRGRSCKPAVGCGSSEVPSPSPLSSIFHRSCRSRRCRSSRTRSYRICVRARGQGKGKRKGNASSLGLCQVPVLPCSRGKVEVTSTLHSLVFREGASQDLFGKVVPRMIVLVRFVFDRRTCDRSMHAGHP